MTRIRILRTKSCGSRNKLKLEPSSLGAILTEDPYFDAKRDPRIIERSHREDQHTAVGYHGCGGENDGVGSTHIEPVYGSHAVRG